MILPLGLAEAPSPRKPWMSVLLVLACVGTFAADAWHLRSSSPRLEQLALFRAYWAEHPYLLPPGDIAALLEPEEVQKAQAEREKRLWAGTLPDDATIEAERKEWLAPILIGLEDSWHYEWGFVPAHGLSQDGWVTHQFLHASLAHLLGNLLFYLLVGPALELLIGPYLFLLLYLGAGIVAMLCQYAVSVSSPVPIIGASGAIAGCMGAFTVRFRKEKFRLLLLLPRRTLEVPAWLWGAVWIGEQLLLLILGGIGGQGIAVLAHIGGFGFGAASGYLFTRLSWFATAREILGLRTPSEDLAWADAAAEQGELEKAIHAYRLVLQQQPKSLPALWGLTRALFATGENEEASEVYDAVLEQWLKDDSAALIQQSLRLYAGQLDTKLLAPERAAVVARPLEFLDSSRALWAYENAAGAGIPEAVLRLAEILAERGNRDAALEMVQQFRALPPRPDLQIRVDALSRTLGAPVARPG